MLGLPPDRATLDTWVNVQDAATWGGLETGLVRCVTRQLGDQNLTSLQVLAVIPTEVFEQALSNTVLLRMLHIESTTRHCFTKDVTH